MSGDDNLAITGRELAQRLMDRAEKSALAQVRIDATLQQIAATVADHHARLAAVSINQQSIADLQGRIGRLESFPLLTPEEVVDIRRGLHVMRDRKVTDALDPDEIAFVREAIRIWDRIEMTMAQAEFNATRITDFAVRLDAQRTGLDDLMRRTYELESVKVLSSEEVLDILHMLRGYKIKTADHHLVRQNAAVGALVVSISAVISILVEIVRRAFGLP